ncbi:gluconolactonase [Saccharothrix sp. NRRL B-16348]|uniref:SMP-30/gluconolactonase/LRE family protein n=1 Tax=Saccharothrix sp. NRRL B-16348 TaxID=1415542 RepID=UPI0006ADFA94|nr:SMP-30/gluconolactonase/LRE family protein [Saccharothrix sp. NRRL B-16348]KOX16046.1 gluconolactonase [Saccharothrix sp. NRRL B-16348]
MTHRRTPRHRRTRTLTAVAIAIAGAVAPSAPGAFADAAMASPCTPGATYGPPLPTPQVTSQLIRGGFNFLEGPTWDQRTGTLLLSNMQNPTGPQGVQPSSVLRFTPPSTFETFIADSGSNGLAITSDGSRLLAATHDNRTLSSYSLTDRSRTTVAPNYLGRAFNSPNDLTTRSDGTTYFTDPNYQRGNRADEQGGRTGVFRVRDGVVSLVDNTLAQPNGIVLSPDGTTLYVGATGSNAIVKYTVFPDGSTGNRTTFASIRTPDGGTIDCAGNLYWASFNEGLVHVFSPSGAWLGTISAGRNSTNVAFGGPDGQTLYITSGVSGGFGLYQARLNVPGNPY